MPLGNGWRVHPFLPEGSQAEDWRSEEHTSEFQSRSDLVCRLLLEKKNQRCSAGECHASLSAAQRICRLKDPDEVRRARLVHADRGPGQVELVRFFFLNVAASPEIYTFALPDPFPN